MTINRDALIVAYAAHNQCSIREADAVLRHVEIAYAEKVHADLLQQLDDADGARMAEESKARRELRKQLEQRTALLRWNQKYARNRKKEADGRRQYAEDLKAKIIEQAHKIDDLKTTLDEHQHHIAALRAGEEPRWSLFKSRPGEDTYIAWSGVCESPVMVGTRREMLDEGYSVWRLDKADACGTSNPIYAPSWWDNGLLIAEQRGILRRERIAEYSQLYLAGEKDKAFDCLEPFEDETEVRRD